jgi:hypothetical protein
MGIQKVPMSDENIRWTSLFRSPFFNPSVMFRKNILVDNNLLYRKEFAPAEDYDLWIQLLKHSKGMNFSKPLANYRVHGSNITTTQQDSMYKSSTLISKDAITSFFPEILTNFHYDEIDNVRKMLFASTRQYRSLSQIRIRSSIDYIHFWEKYKAQKQLSENEQKEIERRVIIRSCQMGFFPPKENDLDLLKNELKTLNKDWLIIFLSSLPDGFLSFLRERLFWKFR